MHEYAPCVGCGKPIHPKLHAPGAPEGGRCVTCRPVGPVMRLPEDQLAQLADLISERLGQRERPG